jgi:hypothetical protein
MGFSSKILQARDYKFSPRNDTADKHNLSRHVFIERDGQVNEVIRLNVLDDRHREDIVGYHFCLQYAQSYYCSDSDAPQFYVVGRDCPWDLEYVLHDGTNFFLEITRVADKSLLTAIQRENEASRLLGKHELKGFEILKVEKCFPGTFPEEMIRQASSKLGRSSTFHHEPEMHPMKLYLRPTMWPQLLDVKQEMRISIEKKLNKSHEGKEKTILVLDNLTTHSSATAFYEAVDALSDFIASTPFLSIWLYTGYYSDNDGKNCEFAFLPIKLSAADSELLENEAEKPESRSQLGCSWHSWIAAHMRQLSRAKG